MTYDQSRKTGENLLKSIDDIHQWARGISEISSKTDLIALNASIEASRNGQAHPWLAVVSDEVALLSEKIQKALSGIESACNELQKNAQEVIQTHREKGPSC